MRAIGASYGCAPSLHRPPGLWTTAGLVALADEGR
jgi:hypothetical protein